MAAPVRFVIPKRLEGACSGELVMAHVLRFDDEFDVRTARRIEAILLAADAHASICLDLRRVRHVPDAAVGVVADALLQRRALNVVIRGLSQHQVRLLRYMGLESVASA
jgi:anti-anti-sigma regulatory factor